MDIQDYRNTVDNIDKNIGALLNERLNVCRQIGTVKKKKKIPVTDAQREEEVLKKVSEAGDSIPNREAIRNIYKAIIDETKKLEGMD